MEIHHHNPIISWRNHQRILFLKGFYKNRQLVLELLENFEQTGEVAHDSIDRILETHFRSLKDLSHVLYRMADDQQLNRRKQRLFDKIMGEMWHELDKARNNIRLIEAYSTMITDYDDEKSDKMWRTLTHIENQILNTARKDLPLEFKRVKQIMNQLVPLFESILSVYHDNEVVYRTLYFSRDYFDALCPPSTVAYFFPLLFGSEAEGYLRLIRSLIRTKHLKQANLILDEFRIWIESHGKFHNLFKQAETEVGQAKL
jgi:hypothetical protein